MPISVGGIPLSPRSSHARIHRGEKFSTSFSLLAVADDGTLLILISVGSGKELHISGEAESEGNGTLELFEGTTTSDDGTGINETNAKRTGTPTVSNAAVFHTPTVSGVGTQLGETAIIIGGIKSKTFGGSSGPPGGDPGEFILKVSTKYLVRLTNKSGGAADLQIALSWYEANP